MGQSRTVFHWVGCAKTRVALPGWKSSQCVGKGGKGRLVRELFCQRVLPLHPFSLKFQGHLPTWWNRSFLVSTRKICFWYVLGSCWHCGHFEKYLPNLILNSSCSQRGGALLCWSPVGASLPCIFLDTLPSRDPWKGSLVGTAAGWTWYLSLCVVLEPENTDFF